jgi:hypothetical protein
MLVKMKTLLGVVAAIVLAALRLVRRHFLISVFRLLNVKNQAERIANVATRNGRILFYNRATSGE